MELIKTASYDFQSDGSSAIIYQSLLREMICVYLSAGQKFETAG